MRPAIAATREHSTRVMARARRARHRSRRVGREGRRLRREAVAGRALGRHMPGANPLTLTLTWEILTGRGLLRSEVGADATR
jgi:hypothetical protein